MFDQVDLQKILEAMQEKAETLYATAPANYPATRGRQGLFAIALRDSQHPSRWWSLEETFGDACYKLPTQQNGRAINRGESNIGVLQSKFAYSKRTGNDSGAPIGEVLEGESFWKGAIFDGPEKRALFGFSGFSELDDVVIAQAGREEYVRQMGE